MVFLFFFFLWIDWKDAPSVVDKALYISSESLGKAVPKNAFRPFGAVPAQKGCDRAEARMRFARLLGAHDLHSRHRAAAERSPRAYWARGLRGQLKKSPAAAQDRQFPFWGGGGGSTWRADAHPCRNRGKGGRGYRNRHAGGPDLLDPAPRTWWLGVRRQGGADVPGRLGCFRAENSGQAESKGARAAQTPREGWVSSAAGDRNPIRGHRWTAAGPNAVRGRGRGQGGRLRTRPRRRPSQRRRQKQGDRKNFAGRRRPGRDRPTETPTARGRPPSTPRSSRGRHPVRAAGAPRW